MRMIRDWFTEADGHTWDIGRMQWFVATVVFLGLSIWAYGWKGQAFDPTAFGIGLASVLAAGGGMIWMKDKEKAPDVKIP